MKKILYFLALIPFLAVAQNKNGELVSPESETQKGPKYKNERKYVNAESFEMVSSAEKNEVKGPKYKNKRKTGKPAQNIQVVTYDHLKGPAYKNKRLRK